MAKITFEFDMFEDRDELKIYKAVDRLYFALDEIYNMARTELKHGNEKLSDHIEDLLEKIKWKAGIVHDLEGE